MTGPFFPSFLQNNMAEKKKQRHKYIQTYISKYKHTHMHPRSREEDIARTRCLASQPEIVDTFKKSERHSPSGVAGEDLSADRVTKVDALGKHLWQGTLRAVMHSLNAWPWVASGEWVCVWGGVASRRARAEAEARVKKSRAWGLVGLVVHVFSPFFLFAGLFSRRGRCDLLTLMG